MESLPLARRVQRFYFAGLNLFVILYAIVSLRWEFVNDSPLFLYSAFLMKQYHLVPYRDFFEMNSPGTLALFFVLYEIVQTSQIMFRIIDLFSLSIIVGGSWIYLRGLQGKKTAMAGPLLFAVIYLRMGAMNSMQREYIALIPLVLSLIIAFRMRRWSAPLRSFLIGVLFGFTFTIKPHLAIACPIIWGGMVLRDAYAQQDPPERRIVPLIGEMVALAAGFAILPAIVYLYLLFNGAINDFLDIARHYWPLYSQLDGDGRLRSEVGEAMQALDIETLFSPLRAFPFYGLLPIGVFLGLRAAWQNREKRIEVLVLYLLIPCFMVYIWIGNKGWWYHRLPMLLILCFVAGFSLWDRGVFRNSRNSAILAAIVLFVTFTSLPLWPLYADYLDVFTAKARVFSQNNSAQQIATFLEDNMVSEDRVLPLDVTGGAIHGMYLAGARIGSSFIYDFHFYHHCDHPYIQGLRNRLIEEIDTEEPRYVIQFRHRWRPFGPGTCEAFPELDHVLAKDYRAVVDVRDYRILERDNSAGGDLRYAASWYRNYLPLAIRTYP